MNIERGGIAMLGGSEMLQHAVPPGMWQWKWSMIQHTPLGELSRFI